MPFDRVPHTQNQHEGDVRDGLGPALQPCRLLKGEPLPVPESTVEIEKRKQAEARKQKKKLKEEEAKQKAAQKAKLAAQKAREKELEKVRREDKQRADAAKRVAVDTKRKADKVKREVRARNARPPCSTKKRRSQIAHWPPANRFQSRIVSSLASARCLVARAGNTRLRSSSFLL